MKLPARAVSCHHRGEGRPQRAPPDTSQFDEDAFTVNTKSTLRTLLALAVLALALTGASAQDDNATVQVALFYSPTCPHCHEIIDNFLPTILPRFGDQIEMIYIDVSNQGGSMAMFDACNALNVPENRCGGVPAMVIADQYMVGSAEIPARMETLVNTHLATGGADLSRLPLLWEAMVAQGMTGTASSEVTAPAGVGARFASDLLGNTTAVVVLLALVVSLGAVGGALAGSPSLFNGLTPQLVTAGALASGVAVIGGVATGGGGFPALLAALIAGLLIVALVRVVRNPNPDHAIPPILLAGLGVATYLSYVETGGAEAVCGVVGDCNAVQASPYAVVFGVPVGVIGLVGYVLLFAAWGLGRFREGRVAALGRAGVLVMALGGVAFSAYLTFLEPFVIGAVCAWCLTSALTMLAVLWLSAPAGRAALNTLRRDDTPTAHQPESATSG